MPQLSALQPHLPVIAVVGGALALGVFLLPSAAEIGSHLHPQRDAGQALQYLEQALVERGPLPEIAVPLAKLLGAAGQPARGLAVLGGVDPTQQGPSARAVHRELLALAGEDQALAAELEAATARQPDVAQLDVLAEIYARQQLLELQAAVLDRAIALRPDDPPRIRDAAHLHNRIGHRNRALSLLDGLWSRRPDAFRDADFALLVALRAQLDPSDAAVRLVAEHATAFVGQLPVAALVQPFFDADRLADVDSLLSPWLGEADPDHRALELWLRALIAQGRTAEAAERLRGILTGGPGLGTAVSLLCEVSLAAGDYRTALGVAERAHFRDMDGRVLVWLAELLLGLHDRSAAAVVLADHDAAEPVTDAGVLRWARLWWQAGDAGRALQHLPRVASESPSRQAARALLLAVAGRSEEALQIAERPNFAHLLLRDQAALVTGQAPARAGQDGTAVAPQPGRGLALRAVQDWLMALVQIAATERRPALAVYSLRAQLALRPGQRNLQWALAAAHLQLAQPELALATLRAIAAPLQDSERQAEREILLAAYRAQLPVREPLVAAALQFLAGADLRRPEAVSWVHLLLELGANRQALPYVARLARLHRGAWAQRQLALLRELGASAEVLELLRQKGLDGSAPRAERLDAAAQLQLSGDRGTALQVLQEVAASDPPDSDAVAQLLHLWGPRPGAAATAWLRERAAAASGAVQLAWLRHLLWVGAAAAVAELLGSDPPDGPALALAVDALQQAKQHKVLAGLTLRRVAQQTDPQLVARLAALAAGHGQRQAAEVAYARLLELQPSDASALRYLARAAIGEPQRAIRLWERYFHLPPEALQGASWRDRAAYGALLLGTADRRTQGETELANALRLLAGETMAPGERDIEGGRLLSQLGRTREAIALWERALPGRPCDDNLRADLVAALLAVQDGERAAAWVDPPAACRPTRR